VTGQHQHHALKDPQYTIDYHKGELLTAAEIASETEAERASHAALRKPPLVLEADEAVVLKALEERMAKANAAGTQTTPGTSK
jgi:threonine synthase